MIKVDKDKIRELTEVIGQLLYIPGSNLFIVIEKIEFETRIISTTKLLFFTSERTEYWVTKLVIWSYFHENKCWSIIQSKKAGEMLLTYYDLVKYRNIYYDHIQPALEKIDSLPFELSNPTNL